MTTGPHTKINELTYLKWAYSEPNVWEKITLASFIEVRTVPSEVYFAAAFHDTRVYMLKMSRAVLCLVARRFLWNLTVSHLHYSPEVVFSVNVLVNLMDLEP